MKFPPLHAVLLLSVAIPLAAADRLFLFDRDATTATVLTAPGLAPVGAVNVQRGAFTALRAGARTYVVAAGGVSVLDERLRHVGEIAPGDETATAAALDAYASRLLVAAGAGLYRIDTETNRIDSRIETGVKASAIHVPADGRVAYLLTLGSRRAKAIDLETGFALPGFVDLAATPGVFAGAFLGAGSEVFSASPLLGGIGGRVLQSDAAAALLAASPSGATLLRTSAGLVHRAADGAVTPLWASGTVAHAALSVDGKTVYLTKDDGSVTALDTQVEGSQRTAWLASAPTAMALVGESPQQVTLTKVSGDNQAVLSGAAFQIVVSGPIGGIPMTVGSNSPAAQCDEPPPLSGVTPISCVANTVTSTTTVQLTVSAAGANAVFTIAVFPAGQPDGLFKISGDNANVGPGGLFALVVESRVNGGLPNSGTPVMVTDNSSVVSCPAVGLTTNTAGRATINCSVAGTVPISETATITVTDSAMSSVNFTANIIGATGGNDALVKITPDPITVFEDQGFTITIEARLGGTPQANVPLTITGGGGIVLCPQQATTGGNGQATLACGAGPVNADASTQITISDGTRNVVYTVNVKNATLVNGIQKVSGDNQTVPQNTQFPLPLVVRAVTGGQPDDGLLLAVTVNNPAATCSVSTVTDQNGLGSITCAAGAVAGITQVQIQVNDASNRMLAEPFLATITPGTSGGAATAISVVAGANLSARVGDTLPGAVQLRAETSNGTPVPAANIFPRGPQGVTFNPAAAQTNFAGLATFDVSFACAPATGQLQFGLTSGSTEATAAYTLGAGPLGQFKKIQGDAQTGAPGQRLPTALVIESADQCGTLLPGIPLSWSVVPPEAATLEAVSSVTNAQARASVLVRPSTRGGAYQVRAISTQNANVLATFALTTQNAPSQLAIVSGDQQTVPAGAAAASPLVVAVLSATGQPVQGVTVTFQVTSGAGTLGSASTASDAQGRAGTTFTAGALRGPVAVRATAAGQTVQFNLTVGGGAPQLQVAGFVNGASFRPGFVPGSTGSIFGVNITEGVTGAVSAPYDPASGFPTLFRGVRVTVGGVAAPILSLANVNGQEQINIQVPFGLPQGVVSVIVENNGTQSSIDGIPVFGEQPGIFEFQSGNQRLAAVLHADFSVVTQSNPARPDEALQLFVTGMGRVDPAVQTNVAGPSGPPANTVLQPAVTLNGSSQDVLASVYAPQLITVYQINFRVRADTRPGLLRLVVTADDSPSQEAFLPVAAAL